LTGCFCSDRIWAIQSKVPTWTRQMILTIGFGSSLVFDIVGSATSRNALWTLGVHISAKAETRNTTLRMTVPYFTDASQGVVVATDGHHLGLFTSNCSLAPACKYNARKEKPVGAKLCNSLFEESRRILIKPQDRLTADPSIYRSLTLPLLRRARKRMSGTATIVRILEGDEPSSFGGSLGRNCSSQAMKKHPNSGHRIAVLMLCGPKGQCRGDS